MIISRKINNNTGNNINCVEKVRGTFGLNERFQDYKINSFVKTNPTLGPGSYDPLENFKK